jgi:hypothetical protein
MPEKEKPQIPMREREIEATIRTRNQNSEWRIVYSLQLKLKDIFNRPWLIIIFSNNQQQTC